MSEENANLQLEIFGRVQGVNFRQNMIRKAKELSLKGFVANKDDGSVVAEAEGPIGDLQKLLEWSQKGVFPARITGMTFHWGEYKGKYKEFGVERKGESFLIDNIKGVINLGKRALNPHETMNIPEHVVIIPDGNRRWARSKGWKAYVGHRKGIEHDKMSGIFEEAQKMGVKYLTLWGFSTENWDRDEKEIEFLWDLFKKNIEKWGSEFEKKQIKFTHLGRKDRLPKDLVKMMTDLEKNTYNNKKLSFQLCLDYGGRDDIVRAINTLIKEGKENITEKDLDFYLDTKGDIPNPDLIIRTSGEQRTSGIFAYQGAYAELYFTDKHFPDFKANDLKLAVMDYSARTRRFGGTSKNDLTNVNEDSLIDPDEEKTETSLGLA